MSYDVIGDIHGHADKLERLLTSMGYRHRAGAWRHPDRTAVFVGDFIDRGEKGVETVRIVRDMVESGSALAVMGNHELNAIAWHTPHPVRADEYLRSRDPTGKGERNRHQHRAFLAQVEDHPALHQELVDWFLTLPLWIEHRAFRVVHACWHDERLRWLSPRLKDGRYLSRELLAEATEKPSETDASGPTIFEAVETLLKGLEIPLPASHTFVDKDGVARHQVRTRWWDRDARTYRQLAIWKEHDHGLLPDIDVPAVSMVEYPEDRPTFFGHYWMTGTPCPMSPSAVCVDYSAGLGGPLVAYRLEEGKAVSAEDFVWVE